VTFLISSKKKTIGKYDIASRVFEKYVLSVILSAIFENVTTGRGKWSACRIQQL
jgi:hypothetical protein